MLTIGKVIDDLGGLSRVASVLSVSVQAVSNMKSRGVFPPRHWPALVREAKEKGLSDITFDALEGMQSPNTASVEEPLPSDAQSNEPREAAQ